MTIEAPSESNAFLMGHAKLLLSSFHQLTKKHLIDASLSDVEQSRALYDAEFCVLSHNTADEPVLNYSNNAGLELFELNWQELITLESKHTAEPQIRAERDKLLAEVSEKGYIDSYRGVRVSTTGKRFRIEKSIVWNIVDEQGKYHGQAAALFAWSLL